ncbi:MAG: ABC transporter permease [Bacteroidales bacterium]
MFTNNLKIAFRKIKRDRLYSIINITGLSIGIASCILIFLFVQDEMKYDKFHEHSNRCYRLLSKDAEKEEVSAAHPGPLLPAIGEKIPEIEKSIRAILFYNDKIIRNEDKQFLTDLIYADSSFFEMFSFRLKEGNPQEVLKAPMSAVLTQSAAEKYFGKNENPIGKTLKLSNKYDLVVTGLMENFPEQSHMQADIVISYNSLEKVNPYAISNWGMTAASVYMLVKPNTEITQLENKIKETYLSSKPEGLPEHDFILQPLNKIYLNSADVQWDYIRKGDIKVVKSLSIVAVLILIIACFNYINLSTANYTKEANNISISKTLGAKRKQLIFKYFTETAIMTLIAIFIAMLITQLSMPAFNNFTGKSIQTNILANNPLTWSLIIIFVITVLTGGSYPAFFLSGFKPLRTMKAQNPALMFGVNSHGFWRKTFVITQFTIAIALIISTFIIVKQINLITKEKTGFDKEQVIAVKNPWGDKMNERHNRYMSALKENPYIIRAGGSFNIPGENINNYTPFYKSQEKKFNAGYNVVSSEYFSVLNSKFVAGRNFDKEMRTDSTAIVINKKLASQLEFDNPVGKEVRTGATESPVKIIGIVEDIQYSSLHQETMPVFYKLDPGRKLNIILKIQKGKTSETLAFLKNKWEKMNPDWPFRYEFLDEKIDNAYKTELKTIALIRIFTFLSIFLSCLGVFGFAGFMIKQRTKEIGIRKVNGATANNILTLLNKDFTRWVIIAFVIACPVAYYFMNNWLQNFAYKTNLSWWIFASAGIITIIITTTTVSWQSWRAARQNPARSLRYE